MNAIVDTHGKLLGEPEAEESRALVPAANPLDIAPEAFRGALARRGENRKALMEWVRSSLVKGTDFGHIHVVSKSKCPDGNQCQNSSHWSKACLFKPGAEKGYPVIAGEAASATLTRNHVSFFDATRIFDDEPTPVYMDNCCHYTLKGYEILADFIARSILRSKGAWNQKGTGF